MKCFFCIIGFLILSNFSAQHKIFIYEYQYKIDSLNKDKVDKEMMILDVSEFKSIYFSYQKYVDDSLNNEELKKVESKTPFISKKSKILDVVSKDFILGKENLYTAIDGDYYKLEQNEKIKWKIFPETKMFFGYKVQKAISYFGGRQWIAWFAAEISVHDGPYIFSGLPGLILQIEDINKDHEFKLVSIKNQDNKFGFSIVKDVEKNSSEVTEKVFNQIWHKYKNDPAIKIRQIISSSNGEFSMYNSEGREMSKNEIIKFREKIELNRIAHFNNFINLTLYR